jgi:hypothetical protein
MAGEETTNQGNIRPEYNNATTGLNLDQTVNQIPKGKLTYALNAAVENFDANSVNYQNEPGNEFCLQFPEGYQLIGEHFINEKNKHVFFLANPDTGDSEIGYMDNNDCIYRTYINGKCLNFNVKYPIHKAVHKITNCTTEIYWTDGYNSRRYLDLENIPYKLQSGANLCNPTYTNEIDCNQLNIQPDFNIPQLEVIDVTTGGDLQAGTYQFAVQYSDSVSQGYTSYFSVTNPTPIANTQITTPNFNYQVGKSIKVKVSNLDVEGLYKYFNLAVIKTINGISSIELIGTYFINSDEQTITYTGQNKSDIRLTIDNIFEKYPYYEIAQDITAVRDILVWDNLTSIDRVNYQQIANQIQLQWETWRIPNTENYADELNATNLRGYLRDEVYAFEIVFLLKNGKQTDGFHIPGRPANVNDLTPVPDTNFDFIGDPDYTIGTIGYSPYWKIYNTASVLGTSPGYSPNADYKGPYQYGEFAYWESLEKYPCNKDVWGDLADQPIRHHKFPDVRVSPIFESALYSSPGSMVMQQDAVFPVGVRIDTAYVATLIANSNLTQEQKDNIAGFKIVRGDRGPNKSIVAKGILRNVGKYNRDETDYYFPNYPYNDLRRDPFLLEKNNAYSANALLSNTLDGTCRNYTVKSYQTGTTFTYVDAYTGATKTYPEIGTMTNGEIATVCAVGSPQISAGKGCVISNTYKLYRITVGPTYGGTRVFSVYPPIDGPVVPSAVPVPVGYASWCDYCQAVPADILCKDKNGDNPRALNEVEVSVLAGNSLVIHSVTDPIFLRGVNREWEVEEVDAIGYNICTPQPLNAFVDEDLKYRQIFNSPETSFGQPFLGNVLKLENAIFGAGKAHFVQVKKNAMYRLATKEAQQDALASADAIATITTPADALSLFAAYQAYLTIYVNSIPKRNYAYSFNSIASYDYGADIDNDLGIKQRPLDIAQYLIPGVQSVGFNEKTINNFQRESSVYLKTSQRTLTYQRPYSTYNLCNTGSGLLFYSITFTYTDIVTGLPTTITVSPGNCATVDSFTYPTFPIGFFWNTITVVSSSTISFTGPVPSLPFPSDSPDVSALGVVDNSRFALGDKSNISATCSAPGKEVPINVVSYYASIKNLAASQYGQIYSYQTIDTGFQRDITPVTVATYETIFGGDTFISKFAFKTKLPFFFDNRVNAPDDSDIFYDEIGNVAYPKYWHSARSVLSDVSAAGFYLRNFISFKAHNFDCPNTQTPESNPGRTYYDGKMYLFAYGIPYFYCESSYNVDLRQAFNTEEGDFWPHVSTSIPDEWLQETKVTIAQDNTYYYNVTYSKQNKENVFTHIPNDWKQICYTNYPFRAIYSNQQDTDVDNRVNNWLIYKPLSYFDFPQNYGKLVSLDGIQNKAVLARFENKSLLYNTMLTVETSNPQAAYLGNDTLFKSSPPIDFAETDLGYVGCQNKMLLKIPQGQITVDAKRGQIFLISGNQAQDLSAFGSGLNRFFTDHLAFEILRHFPNVNIDNHFNGLGLHGVYDSKYDRVIITKLDYIPRNKNVKYDPVTQEFYIEKVYIQNPSSTTTSSTTSTYPGTTTTTTTPKPIITREVVYLTDETYFCNKSWTLSFNMNTMSWISFHSYIPNWYIAENNFFYSGLNDCCTTLDALVGQPGPITTTTTTTAFVCQCNTYEVSNFTGFTQQYDYYDCNNVLHPAVTILDNETQYVCVCNDNIQYNDRSLIVTLIAGTCITTTTSTTTTAYTGCNLDGVACEQTTTTTTSSTSTTTTTTTIACECHDAQITDNAGYFFFDCGGNYVAGGGASGAVVCFNIYQPYSANLLDLGISGTCLCPGQTTTTTSTSTSTTTTTTTAYGTNCTLYQIQPVESISVEWENCGTTIVLSGTYVSTQLICANTGSLGITGGTGIITVIGPC